MRSPPDHESPISPNPTPAPILRTDPLNQPTVAFQGAFGAFGELAVRSGWPDGVPHPMSTFERVVASVAAGIRQESPTYVGHHPAALTQCRWLLAAHPVLIRGRGSP